MVKSKEEKMKILLFAVVALFLIGCSDNKSTSKETAKAEPVKTEVVKEVGAVKKSVAPKEQEVVVAEKKAEPVVKTVVEAPKEAESAVATVDGAKLFKACSSCHGAKAEKKALGKSQVIAGWKSSKIVNALNGYKDGSYGSTMKAVMQGQAAKLSDADIKALAAYISKL